jgi:hypothetical protein
MHRHKQRDTTPPAALASNDGPPGPAVTPVHVIMPTAVYTADQAQRILRLRPSTIRREVREGRLRVSRRGGRYYLLGEWLIEWLRAGEVRRRRQAPTPAEDDRGAGTAQTSGRG